MRENRAEKREKEIQTQRLIGAVWKKAWLICLTAVACAVLSLLITRYLITPEYRSTAMFYVNNGSASGDNGIYSIASGDLSAAKSLVDSYIVILESRESLNQVIAHAGVDRSCEEVKEMITAASVNSTEIFQVVVSSPDPQEADKIANAIALVLPRRIAGIIENSSAKVLEISAVAVKPGYPRKTLNVLVGFAVGFAVSVILVLVREFFDQTIRSEKDIAFTEKYPVFASVPDMRSPSKGGFQPGIGSKRKGKSPRDERQDALVGENLSFAASEAYKLLRTKLQFSFTDEKSSRILGVSSAMAGEGKSLSAINLAHGLAQLNKRVLLIDCDMRKSSISSKLPVSKLPGLSDFLSGQSDLERLFQNCGIPGDESAFSVIAAGRNPPNPIELLSSLRMAKLLAVLRNRFDYIVLDLPPVGEVSDALTVAKETDGMLLVVRQNYGNRAKYADAVAQFEFVDARILGVIYNCAGDPGEGINRKYYQKYGSWYAGRGGKNAADKE